MQNKSLINKFKLIIATNLFNSNEDFSNKDNGYFLSETIEKSIKSAALINKNGIYLTK